MSLPGSVPEPIREATEGYTWYPVTAGMSTASTWRLERRGSATLYLKKDRDQFPDELAHERSVIEWLAGLRWWSVTEIQASPEQFAPRELGYRLAELVANGPDGEPVDAGV